jgi:hypothetical protein
MFFYSGFTNGTYRSWRALSALKVSIDLLDRTRR